MAESVLTTHQVSMTEWFAAIGEVEESKAFRVEDNTKQERLEFLKNTISLPFRSPQVFPAQEALDCSPAFQKVLNEQGDMPCAFRLTATDPALPKFRNRGLTVRECYETWFKQLDIDYKEYTLSIFPNESGIRWSTIFVVNEEAIFGEIIGGIHSQLSQGETTTQSYYFRYDFTTWEVRPHNPEVIEELTRTIEPLRTSLAAQPAVIAELGARFSHDFLMGYFETVVPPDNQVYFIDYNRILPSHIATPSAFTTSTAIEVVTGMPAFAGIATGKVVQVSHDTVGTTDFPEGSILVCDNTDVRYLPFMKKAAAIVTDRGGMLSHAAIIARELKKPTLIGCGDAMEKLSNGAMVVVDTTSGTAQLV